MLNRMFAVVFLVLMANVEIVLATSTLDQYQEKATNWLDCDSNYWHAQSFKPVLPYLTSVEIYFEQNQSCSGNFTIEIWECNPSAGIYSDPRVGSTPIATKTINSITTGSQPDCWVSWKFDSPINVSQYFAANQNPLLILLKSQNTAPPVPCSTANPYSAGVRYWLVNGNSWSKYTGHDLMFRTYGEFLNIIQQDATTWLDCNANYWHGQSFRPTEPYLSGVELYFYHDESFTGDFTAEIWECNQSAGTYNDPRIGTVPLASKTIKSIATSAQPDCWVRWDFDEPLDVRKYLDVNSNLLLIFVKTSNTGPAICCTSNNPYSGGVRYWCTNGSSWSKYTNYDMRFRTYCTEPSIVSYLRNGDFSNYRSHSCIPAGWWPRNDPCMGSSYSFSLDPTPIASQNGPSDIIIQANTVGAGYYVQYLDIPRGDYTLAVDVCAPENTEARIIAPKYYDSNSIYRDILNTRGWKREKLDFSADGKAELCLASVGTGSVRFRRAELIIRSLNSSLVPMEDSTNIGAIILGYDATLVEKFAAAELQKYIYKVTGCIPGLQGRDQTYSGRRILIGNAVDVNNFVLPKDVVQENATTWLDYNANDWHGQSFRPTLPYLTAVEGYFWPNESYSGSFTVEIWECNSLAGIYDDPRIGSGPIVTKTITSIITSSQPNCWVRWKFDSPVDVSEFVEPNHHPLLILWKGQDAAPAIVSSNANPYSVGARYWLINGNSWSKYVACDMKFRTYGRLTDAPADSYIIDYNGDDIVLSGNTGRGTLYAVYDFLKFQGCGWYMPGSYGEVVPTRTSLLLPAMAQIQIPDYDVRGFLITPQQYYINGGWIYYPVEEYLDWAIRNRINALAYGSNTLDFGAFRGFSHEQTINHSWCNYLFDDHSEWWPWVELGGVSQRRKLHISGRPNQLCVSNSNLRDYVFNDAKQYLASRPLYSIFALNPNDYTFWCECSQCRLLDPDGGLGYWTKDLASGCPNVEMTDRALNFVNNIANRIQQVDSKEKIEMYAYGPTLEPPTNEQLEASVLVKFCWHGAPVNRSIADTNYTMNYNTSSRLGGWKNAQARQFGLYDYGNWQYPDIPNFWYFHQTDYLKHFHDEWGFRHCLGETGHNLYSSMMWYNLRAKSYWNVDIDYVSEINDICHAFYGQAADYMYSYYMFMQQRELDSLIWDDDPDAMQHSVDLIDFNVPYMQQAQAYLSDANSVTVGDPNIQSRLAYILFAHAHMTVEVGRNEIPLSYSSRQTISDAFFQANDLAKSYDIKVCSASQSKLQSLWFVPVGHPWMWASEPQATGSSTITMTASTANDPCGVEYLFECTSGGGHNSGWQSSATYVDTGLQSGMQYGYHVKVRDKTPNQYATEWSTILYVRTQ